MRFHFMLILAVLIMPALVSAKTETTPPPLIPSGEIINRAIKKIFDKKGDESLLHLDSVHEGDTNYVWSVYLKSLSCLNIKKYQECLDFGQLVLKLDPTYNYIDYNYNNMAQALDKMGKHNEALAMFQVCLDRFPLSYMTYHNRGLSQAKAGNYELAMADVQKAVEINPFYGTGHRTLGKWCAKEKKTTQAFLSYYMSMLVEPLSSQSLQTLIFLNDTLLSSDYAYKPTGQFISAAGEDDFNKLDKALQSRVALDAKYKSGLKIKFNVAKQAHLLFTNLKQSYRPTNKGFWMEYYAPTFSLIQDQQQFNYALIYSLLSVVKNETIAKEFKKNEAKVKYFGEWFRNELDNKHSTLPYTINNVQKDYTVSRTSSSHYILSMSEMKDGKQSGPGLEFTSKGSLSAKGEFVNGSHHGEWPIYNTDGQLNMVVTYKDGKLNGPYTLYYSHGNKKQEGEFKDGKKNGIIKEYYESGELYSEVNYTDGLYNGVYKEYFKIGVVSTEITYKNGQANGVLKEYYYNGQPYREMTYVDGKINGKVTYYYIHKQMKSEYNYVTGVLEGAYVKYYPNGQISEKGNYTKGGQSGKITQYYADGVLQKETDLDETGKFSGINKEFAHDGKLNLEFDYKKGEITGYRYYDKTGKIIQSGVRKKGRFEFKGVYHDGIISSEGIFESGEVGRIGEWKNYDKNGNLRSKELYNDAGQLQGILTEYFPNGKVESSLNYENDLRDGYYVEYYSNGNIYLEGWYQKNQKQGPWIEYHRNGEIASKYFYVNDEINGNEYEYEPNGILNKINHYKFGILNSITYLDTLGNENCKLHFQGIQDAKIKFNDGSTFECKLYSDVYHGTAVWRNYAGKMTQTGLYANGNREGEWIWYHDNGKIATKGSYVYGSKHGVWTSYYENGQVQSVTIYVHGLKNGKNIDYYENGKIDLEETFNYGDKSGIRYFYSPQGDLQLARHYVDDKITGYQYNKADGNLCDFISMPNETGECIAKYSNGKISRKFTVDKGSFQGPYLEYHNNGNLYRSSVYVDDEEVGETKEFYESGKLSILTKYKAGAKVGKEIEYYENGTVKRESFYLNGKLYGKRKSYSPSGKLTKEESYFFDLKTAEKTFK